MVSHGPEQFVGVCRCESWNCDDVPLNRDDLVLWQLAWPKLARALAHAFDLEPRPADLGLSGTFQIGSWSSAAVPVLFALPATEADLLQSVHLLVGRWRQPFILLTPTARHLGGSVRELLAGVGAGWFPLASIVDCSAPGTLVSRVSPGELFGRFSPQPGETVDASAARQAFALLTKLEGGRSGRSPTVLTVFRLYCIEELSAEQIARKCGCSKPTVLSRLKVIRQETGLPPATLRRFSAQFDQLEDEVSEPRARRIHRRNLFESDSELARKGRGD